MTPLIQFALWLYPHLLRLYPRHFQEEFAAEMTAVFAQSLQGAVAAGWRGILTVLGRELRDWPLNCLREHIWERHRRLLLSPSSFLSGWGAVAAALPFLLYFSSGLVSLNLSLIFLGAGLLVAWWQRWPGWVVSWLGFLIFFGLNWLPYSLLGGEWAWNTIPRLLNELSQIVVQTGWWVVMYGVVRRWPRHGTLVFLPFVTLPWVFTMEFASEAMTAVVSFAAFSLLALTAAAISVQRTASGDIWLLYGGTLLPGTLLALGGVFFSPGMGNTWRNIGPNFMQALAPFMVILLLQSLNAWSRENGPAAQRLARLMSWSTLLAFITLLAIDRLIGPSDLEAFQLNLPPILLTLWLLSVLILLGAGWRLRSRFTPGTRLLAVIILMLVLLPLLYRPAFLSGEVRSLVYDNTLSSAWRVLLPALETADFIIALVGFGGLLLTPSILGRLRRQTATFPPPSPPVSWRARWQRRSQRRQANKPKVNWSWRKRLALLLSLVILLAGGLFLGLVFLPLQWEAEPYTRQVALGDIDGDGDVDAVLGNTMRLFPNIDNVILYNDGSGRFHGDSQTIGMGGISVALLDSNVDGHLDVVIGSMMGGSEFRGSGSGRFHQSTIAASQMPEWGISQLYFQAGDLNGDGITDLFIAGCCGTGISQEPGIMREIAPANRVLMGSESGLVDSQQQLGTSGSRAVDLGDVDGDGDLDAFVGNTQSSSESVGNGAPNEVWLNDSRGNFSDSGQLLGEERTYAVALGDVDGDGDLDALVGNEGADELWLNDGHGRFGNSYQSWSKRHTLAIFFSDLDGDGDLDAVTSHQLTSRFAWWRQGLVWWNDGQGHFTQGEQRFRFRPNAALTVGDVNGDTWPDMVIGSLNEVTVWLNDGSGRFQLHS